MKVDRKKQDLWFIMFDYLYCVQCDFFFFFYWFILCSVTGWYQMVRLAIKILGLARFTCEVFLTEKES